MKDENRIVIPKDLQEEMLKFFLNTSILKKKKQLLSEENEDRSEKNGK